MEGLLPLKVAPIYHMPTVCSSTSHLFTPQDCLQGQYHHPHYTDKETDRELKPLPLLNLTFLLCKESVTLPTSKNWNED